MRITIGLLAFLLFCGFLPRECSRENDQAQADAHAGVDAMTDPGEERIAQGVHNNIEASTEVERDELPPPHQTPQETKDDPAGYQKQSEENKEAAMSGPALAGWIGGGALALLGILRAVPGVHQPIVDIAQGLLENRRDRSKRKEREGLAGAAPVMIDTIRDLGDNASVREVKDKLAKRFPAGAGDVVKEYLESRRRTP